MREQNWKKIDFLIKLPQDSKILMTIIKIRWNWEEDKKSYRLVGSINILYLDGARMSKTFLAYFTRGVST